MTFQKRSHNVKTNVEATLKRFCAGWTASKTTKVELDPLTDIDVLLMAENGIRWGIWPYIYRYSKANDKYMKNFDKNKESSYLQYWDVNNLYGWVIW